MVAHAQTRILRLEELLTKDKIPLHNVPFLYDIEGEIDYDAIDYAIKKIIENNPILRMRIIRKNGAFQAYYADTHISQTITDKEYGDSDRTDRKIFFNQYLDIFNSDSLIKIKLIIHNKEKCQLLILLHHIIADDWSVQLFNRYFLIYYNQFIDETEDKYSKKNIYNEYINLEHDYLNSEKFKNDLEFWDTNYKEHSNFRLDEWISGTNRSDYFYANSLQFTIDSHQGNELNLLCKKHSRSLFSILLSCFYLALDTLIDTNDIPILLGTSGRYSEEFEKAIGMFVNDVLLHNRPRNFKHFDEFWSSCFSNCYEAFQHQKTPIDIIIKKLTSNSSTKIPDIAFLMNNQNKLFDESNNLEKFKIKYEYPILPFSNFTIQWTTNILPNDQLLINILYKDFVSIDLIQNLIETYKNTISKVLDAHHKNKDIKLSTIFSPPTSIKLLPFQEMHWFDYNKEPSNRSDIECISFKIKKNRNVLDTLIDSINYFFSTLHSHAFGSIAQSKDGVYFHKSNSTKMQVNCYKYTNYDEYLDHIKSPLDLQNNEFVRVVTLDTSKKIIFTLLIHHLIIDATTYLSLLNTMELFIKDNKISIEIDQNKTYSFVSQWHKKINDPVFQKKHKKFWKNYLLDKPLTLNFPMKNVVKHSEDGIYKYFSFNIDINSQVRFSELLALYALSIYKLINATRFPIIFARNLREKFQNDILGSFVNLVPQFIEIDEKMTIKDNISLLSEETRKVIKFSSEPFSSIVTELRMARKYDKRCFNIGFLNTHTRSNLEHVSSELSKIIDYQKVKEWPTHLDLNLEYEITPKNKLLARVHYRKNLFSSIFIDNLIETFRNHTIDYYNGKYEQTNENYILEERIKTELSQIILPKVKSIGIVEEFEKIVKLRKNELAVYSGEQSLSYSDLNSISTTIAGNLLKIANPGDKIVVSIERTIQLPAVIFGILKASMVYVPLDPTLPESRKKYIIDDSEAKLIITEDHYKELYAEYPYILINTLYDPVDIKLPITQPDRDAYIIYTSGTTGQPKGVVIQDQSVTILIHSCKKLLNVGHDDIWSCAHSYSFDFSIFEIFGPLLTGGKLALLHSNETKDTHSLWTALKNYKITLLSQTPTSFHMLSMIDEKEKESLTTIKHVVFGGEKLKLMHIKTWLNAYPLDKVSLNNLYGITETTVHNTFYKIQPEDVEKYNILPIGQPLPHLEILLMGPQNNRIPPEQAQVIGEIYVTGHALARGYNNKPELTKEKFIFIGKERYYKSGDLGLYSDGKLFCIGRNDKQIKLRGHRIELGEIENAIANVKSIKNFTLLTKEREAGIELFLLVILNNTDIKTIKNILSNKLPPYMLPDKIIEVDEFKYDHNNKIDTKYLSEKYIDTQPKKDNFSDDFDTSSKVYTILRKIWCHVLDVENFDYYEPFLSQGGTSFSAVVLTVSISKEFKSEISLGWTFRYQSFYEQYNQISKTLGTIEGDFIPITELFVGKNCEKSLYLVHPGLSGTEAYHGLVEQLKEKKVAIYGVESYNLYQHTWIKNVEELAGRYADEILNKNPKGDLYLAGWSYGGILAFQISKILSNKGIDIKKLIIIDSHILSDIPINELKNVLSSTIKTFEKTAAYKALPSSRREYLIALIETELLAMHNFHPKYHDIKSVIINASKQYHPHLHLKTWNEFLPVIKHSIINGDHFSIMNNAKSLKEIATIMLSTVWGKKY